MLRALPPYTLFPYTTLFRSSGSSLDSPAWPRFEYLRIGISFASDPVPRSEEHTTELQSRFDLVCRLLLEKKKRHTDNCFREIILVATRILRLDSHRNPQRHT